MSPTADRSAIRAVLELMGRGETAFIYAPGTQPYARALYLRVNGVAWALWGPGSYRMAGDGRAIHVTRLARRRRA